MFSYALFAVFAGGGALRDASGNVSDIINGTFIPTCVNDHVSKFYLVSYTSYKIYGFSFDSHVNMGFKIRTVLCS